MITMMICLAFVVLMFWVGFKLTGALLAALIWLVFRLPIALIMMVFGVVLLCTILLIPIGMIRAGTGLLLPGIA